MSLILPKFREDMMNH